MMYLYLAVAVVAEVIATSLLKSSDSFTRPGPSIALIIGYGVSFYLLSIVVKQMPTGITYAVWSGLGVVLISILGFVLYGEKLDWPAVAGLTLILSGVLVIHLFSSSVPH